MDKIKVYLTAFITGLMLLSAGVVVYSLVKGNGGGPAGMTKVDGYSHPEPGHPVCDAINPECGTCFGEVINESCYVNEKDLTEAELRVMGL